MPILIFIFNDDISLIPTSKIVGIKKFSKKYRQLKKSLQIIAPKIVISPLLEGF
jgi:hypothetical protein